MENGKIKVGDVFERLGDGIIVIEKILFLYVYRIFVINCHGRIIYYGCYSESELDIFTVKKIDV